MFNQRSCVTEVAIFVFNVYQSLYQAYTQSTQAKEYIYTYKVWLDCNHADRRMAIDHSAHGHLNKAKHTQLCTTSWNWGGRGCNACMLDFWNSAKRSRRGRQWMSWVKSHNVAAADCMLPTLGRWNSFVSRRPFKFIHKYSFQVDIILREKMSDKRAANAMR